MSKPLSPGPWSWIWNREESRRPLLDHLGNSMGFYATEEASNADARLIAAAPELLELLRRAVYDCRAEDDEVWLDYEWVNAAVTAIEKATREKP